MSNPQDILDQAQTLKDEGYNEAYIAQQLDISTSELRQLKADAADAKRFAVIVGGQQMKQAGHSNAEIADILGLSESSVREILEET